MFFTVKLYLQTFESLVYSEKASKKKKIKLFKGGDGELGHWVNITRFEKDIVVWKVKVSFLENKLIFSNLLCYAN